MLFSGGSLSGRLTASRPACILAAATSHTLRHLTSPHLRPPPRPTSPRLFARLPLVVVETCPPTGSVRRDTPGTSVPHRRSPAVSPLSSGPTAPMARCSSRWTDTPLPRDAVPLWLSSDLASRLSCYLHSDTPPPAPRRDTPTGPLRGEVCSTHMHASCPQYHTLPMNHDPRRPPAASRAPSWPVSLFRSLPIRPDTQR